MSRMARIVLPKPIFHTLTRGNHRQNIFKVKNNRKVPFSSALQLCDEQMQYPITKLLGTWLEIIMERVWALNPFDDPHKMYCSAFVRYCYQQAGRDFLGNDVALSNTAPEHIAQSGPFKAEWYGIRRPLLVRGGF